MTTKQIDSTWGKSWDFKLNLKDLWEEFEKEDSELWYDSAGKQIAARIRTAGFYGKYEDQQTLEHICQLFEELDEFSEKEDFNAALACLYDWCDRGKRVWIATTF